MALIVRKSLQSVMLVSAVLAMCTGATAIPMMSPGDLAPYGVASERIISEPSFVLGYTYDSDGVTVLPGAQVVVKNLGTGETVTSESDENGAYTCALIALQTDIVNVTATKGGKIGWNESFAPDALDYGFINVTLSIPHASFQVILRPGWNLFSLPLLANYTARTLPGLVHGDVVVRWDGNQYWILVIDGPANDFDILPSTGYWIFSGTSKTMNLYGAVPIEPQTRTINFPSGAGWTLVGFDSLNESRHASDVPAMYSVAGAVKAVASWDSAAKTYISWVSVVPSLNNFSLVPGQGYFVYCSSSGSFAYDP